MAKTPFEEIGTREYGQRGTDGKLWYVCAITGQVFPEDETVIEDDPTSEYYQMRVARKHRDEPSYKTNEQLRPPTYTDEI